jgi:hypothetical protein
MADAKSLSVAPLSRAFGDQPIGNAHRHAHGCLKDEDSIVEGAQQFGAETLVRLPEVALHWPRA